MFVFVLRTKEYYEYSVISSLLQEAMYAGHPFTIAPVNV